MARQHHINITREFPVPVERLFSHLSEHENLERLFAPARIIRLSSGTDARNGVGSARTIKPYPMPAFVETVTAYHENKLVEYRITKGSPLRNHFGRMTFDSLGAHASRVEFDIVFEGKFPGAGAVFWFILNRGITNGLADLADDKEFLADRA